MAPSPGQFPEESRTALIGVRREHLGDLLIHFGEVGAKCRDQPHQAAHCQRFGLHHGRIPSRRHGLADTLNPFLDQLLRAAIVLVEELPQRPVMAAL